MTKYEYIILEAYDNKWVATFQEDEKRKALKMFHKLDGSNDGGDYYIYKATTNF